MKKNMRIEIGEDQDHMVDNNKNETRKSIAFDIDTKVGDEIYGDYRKIHKTIQKFFELNDFMHPQYSVYESKESMRYALVEMLLREFIREYPDISKCIRDIRVTEIGETHELNRLFDYDGTPGKYKDAYKKDNIKLNKGKSR